MQSRDTQTSYSYVIAIILSLGLSVWASIKSTVINPDGICYALSAKAMLESGTNAGVHLCDQAVWPFYSFCIALVHRVFHLDYVNAAYLLNALFSLISVIAFLKIVRLLCYSSRYLKYALIVLLCAHEFNSVKDYVIRDHGYWAFYLISIYALLKFYRSSALRYALLWSASLLLATLFRVEGIIFLISLPFSAFFMPENRLNNFLKLNLLSIAGLISLILIATHYSFPLHRLLNLKINLLNYFDLTKQHFQQATHHLALSVLSPFAAHEAGKIFALLLCVWYVIEVLANLSFAYSALVIYAWWKKIPDLKYQHKIVLFSYLALNVLITFAFLVKEFFIAKRYLIALSLTLMLWVPFALEYLFERQLKNRWAKIILACLLIATGIGGIIPFGYSKDYMRQSGDWLNQHTAPQNAVYSNDMQVLFYSNHYGKNIYASWASMKNLKHLPRLADGYQVMALRSDKAHSFILAPNTYQALQEFHNSRGDKVSLYLIIQ